MPESMERALTPQHTTESVHRDQSLPLRARGEVTIDGKIGIPDAEEQGIPDTYETDKDRAEAMALMSDEVETRRVKIGTELVAVLHKIESRGMRASPWLAKMLSITRETTILLID